MFFPLSLSLFPLSFSVYFSLSDVIDFFPGLESSEWFFEVPTAVSSQMAANCPRQLLKNCEEFLTPGRGLTATGMKKKLSFEGRLRYIR